MVEEEHLVVEEVATEAAVVASVEAEEASAVAEVSSSLIYLEVHSEGSLIL